MAREAIDFNMDIVNILIDETLKFDVPNNLLPKVYYVKKSVFKQISELKNPEGVLIICKEIDNKINWNENILILDQLRDPGNMGTIIRTAEAFNYNNIVLLGDCVDIYNSKVLRATMGSIFRVNINQEKIEILNNIKKSHTIVATALEEDSIDITTMTKISNHAIIIGNESHGIREEVLKYAHKKVIIPISKNIDSLNAAMASGISMFYLKSIYSKMESEV